MQPWMRVSRSLIHCPFKSVSSPCSLGAFGRTRSGSRPSTHLSFLSFDSRRFIRTEFHRRQDSAMSKLRNGWQTIGSYNIFAWSLSGVETCVVVNADDLKIAFDVGHSIPESITCGNVFISHGHLDHIGGVANHVAKRGLFGMKKARYYVPPHLVSLLRTVTDASFAMAETTEALENVNILPIDVGDTISLPGNYSVKAFPTVHRVPSQGYILYKTVKKLKAEYMGQPSAAIAELHRNNVEIHDIITTPEIAYTGDTMMDVFLDPPTPDLLKVKLLITEATFIDQSDKKDNVKLAKDRGHTHLQEISSNAHLFKDVETILLMHFSTKYSADYIQQHVSARIAPELKDKVLCATVAKEHTS